MDYKTAEKAYTLMSATREARLLRELIIYAIRYAQIRANYWLATPDMRLAMSPDRSRAHDALIDACNILSRSQAKLKEDNSWREILGPDRKEIGDFACHLHAMLGIEAR